MHYLLSNRYVLRRKELLKASHIFDEFFQKIQYLPDVSEKYKSLVSKFKE